MYNTDVIIGMLLMVYGGSLTLISPKFFGETVILTVTGILLVIYHFIKRFIKLKRNRKIFNLLLCIGLLVFVLVEAFIIGCPKISRDNVDYIVVLSTEIEDNNTHLSSMLKGRLNLVVNDVYKYVNDGKIILSGGEVLGNNQCESDLMEEYLINQGIPKDKLMKEDQSMNIEDSLIRVKKLIEKDSNKEIDNSTVKFITTNYNVFSVKLSANKLGYSNVELDSSKTDYYLAPVLYTKEFFKVFKILLLERL